MLTALRRSLFSKSWLVDLPLIALAWWLAFWLRFNLSIPDSYLGLAARTTPIALPCMALGLALAGVPRQSWRYVSLSELRLLAVGVALGALLTTAVAMGLRIDDFPRSVLPISAVLALVLLAGARAAWRTLMELARSRAQTHSGAAPPLPLLIAGTLEEADHALRTLKGAAGWRAGGRRASSRRGRRIRGAPCRACRCWACPPRWLIWPPPAARPPCCWPAPPARRCGARSCCAGPARA
jgi:hypothetical protein